MKSELVSPVLAPKYTGPMVDNRRRVGLAVEGMRRHMTDEGWQLFAGLQEEGYLLCGYGLVTDSMGAAGWDNPSPTVYCNLTHVPSILTYLDPGVVVIQDKREWMGLTADRTRDPRIRFNDVNALADRPDIFKVGVIKDAQNDHALHVESALEAGTHCWLTPYNLDMVAKIAPFLRREHLIRTYHTLNRDEVPPYREEGRLNKAVLSGALNKGVYPLRTRLTEDINEMPDVDLIRHPGYHQRGCQTPTFLQELSRYKVAICTSSRYGYALRKIIEATACGCVVVTNLPWDDKLPFIDKNLVRISSSTPTDVVHDIVGSLIRTYNPERQQQYAKEACSMYDYRCMGYMTAVSIEAARQSYNVRTDINA